MTISPDIGMLGLFPSLDRIGGVEASGRLAWDTFASGNCRNRYLLCYRPGARNGQGQGFGNAKVAGTKIEAIAAALGRIWPVQIVFAWHVGLLRLLPFLRLHDAKVVLFLHGIEAWKRHGPFTRTLLRRVQLFLSNSDHTWERFTALNPEFCDALHQTVHLGMGDEWTGDIPRPGDVPAVVMIGRMLRGERYKGHQDVVKAWPAVLDRMPAAKLWLIGPGELGRDLEHEARSLGIAEAVKAFGAVSEDRKQQLIAQARGLVMPSNSEGFGLVYLEAMRLGRPCLVSVFDAGREVVQPPASGLAVDPGNHSELASALVRLLTLGPEWQRWSEQARQRYGANFTRAIFQKRLLRAVSTVLGPQA
jgi:phosphatidyl-myo-inositol dimannoside synthase